MLETINEYLIGALIPVLLIGSGFYLLARLRFFWMLHPVAVLKPLLKGGRGDSISPRRALAVALAGTLGVGNIVGVSAAIWWGGAGAVFWMLLSAVAAATLKYAEALLSEHGATPYYIKAILSKKGFSRVGGAAACVFVIFCIINSISMGGLIQVGAVAGALEGVMSIDRRISGIALALLAAVTALGGIKRISRVTGTLVPVMSVGFFVMSAAVLILRADALPAVFRLVMSEAFDLSAAGGGVGGFLASRAVRHGVMRGLITNEAGAGTSPMAHAVSDAPSVERGFMGIVEVLVDTVILCGMTAAVICQSFYALEALSYLTKKLPPRAQSAARRLFILFFALCAYLGAVAPPTFTWGLADLAIGLMTLINLPTVLLALEEVKRRTAEYFG